MESEVYVMKLDVFATCLAALVALSVPPSQAADI